MYGILCVLDNTLLGGKKQGPYYPPIPRELFKTDDHELGILQDKQDSIAEFVNKILPDRVKNL